MDQPGQTGRWPFPVRVMGTGRSKSALYLRQLGGEGPWSLAPPTAARAPWGWEGPLVGGDCLQHSLFSCDLFAEGAVAGFSVASVSMSSSGVWPS